MTKRTTELEDVHANSTQSLLEGTALNDSTRAKRPVRERLQQLKMAGGNTRPGYVRRWVIDKKTSSAFGSNIKDKECLGYSVVTNEDINSDKDFAGKLGSVVEKLEFDGHRMVLMEIPEHEYRELQEEKRRIHQNQLQVLSGHGYADGKLDVSTKTN